MNRLCRLGLHSWRFTDWSDGDLDAEGDACARPDCRRIRGTSERLTVEHVDSVVVPPEMMGAFFVPSPTRLVRAPALGDQDTLAQDQQHPSAEEA